MVAIAGFSSMNPQINKILRDNASRVLSFDNNPFYVVFAPTTAQLYRRGEHGEPVLRFSGNIAKVVFDAETSQQRGVQDETQVFPFDEVEFDSNMLPAIDVDYELTTAQQQELVGKGYFTEDFALPQEPYLVDLEFKADLNVKVLPPEYEGDVPIVVVDTTPAAYMVTDLERSEYDMVEPIPNFIELAAQEPERERDTGAELDIEREMFADDDLEYGQGQGEVAARERARASKSATERLYELSGGTLQFTSEELLNRLELSDEQLEDVAREAVYEREQADDFDTDVARRYDEAGLGDIAADTVREREGVVDVRDMDVRDGELELDEDDNTLTDEHEGASATDTKRDAIERAAEQAQERAAEDEIARDGAVDGDTAYGEHRDVSQRVGVIEQERAVAPEANGAQPEQDVELDELDLDEIDFDELEGDVELELDGTEIDSEDREDDLADEVDRDGNYIGERVVDLDTPDQPTGGNASVARKVREQQRRQREREARQAREQGMDMDR